MANWYYYGENGEKVSVTERELIRLAWIGRILPETKIEDPEGKTAPAKNVEGLSFKHCTNCGSPVTKATIDWGMPCKSCGATTIGHNKFCQHCGTALNPEQVVCIKCGKSIRTNEAEIGKSVIWCAIIVLAGLYFLCSGSDMEWLGVVAIVIGVIVFLADLAKLSNKKPPT